MTTKLKFTTWNFILFIFLSFFTMGAGFMESFVNYPLWYIIGPSDAWLEYHRALGPKVIVVLAIPALILQLLSNLLLMIFRPVFIPKWAAWATFLLVVIPVASTFAIQIPIQMQLDNVYSKEIVDRLIKTDWIWRISTTITRSLLIFWILQQFLKDLPAEKKYAAVKYQ